MKSNNPRKSRKSSKAVETISTDFAGRSTVLVVLLSTCAAFLPVLWNGFVDWDDDKTLTQNPHYRGLGWTQLRWMFTTFHAGHYQPLSWVTFGLDYVVWGTEPLGYHLTSLALQIRYDVALVLAMNGELDKATEQFAATIKLNPAHTQAHYNLGVVLANHGRIDDAMRHLRQVLDIDPTFTRAHHQLAVLLTQQGEVEQAIAHLHKALELEPELAEAHESLGRALVRVGRSSEAVQHFEEAVRIGQGASGCPAGAVTLPELRR